MDFIPYTVHKYGQGANSFTSRETRINSYCKHQLNTVTKTETETEGDNCAGIPENPERDSKNFTEKNFTLASLTTTSRFLGGNGSIIVMISCSIKVYIYLQFEDRSKIFFIYFYYILPTTFFIVISHL